MFSLVRFDNLEYIIVPSKRVKGIQGNNCVVKYYSGAKYKAELIETSDQKRNLEELQKNLDKSQLLESFSTPSSSPAILDVSSLDVNTNDQDPIISNIPEGFINSNNEDENLTENTSSYTENDSIYVKNATFTIESSDNNLKNNTYDIETGLEDSLQLSACGEKGNDMINFPEDTIEKEANLGNYSMETEIIPEKFEVTQPTVADFSSENNCTMEIEIIDNTFDVTQPTVADFSSENNDDSSFFPGQSTLNTTQERSDCFAESRSQIVLQSPDFTIINQAHRPNVQELTVPATSTKGGQSKRHFCPYCHTLQAKFARHLVLRHKSEEEVKKFIYFPGQTKERKDLINAIRKKGDFMHNMTPEFNSGILIVSRQRQARSKNTAEDYISCRTCKGFFAKSTLRHHVAKCDKNRKKGEKNIASSSRQLSSYIHNAANENLRTTIFPVLVDDNVVRAIKYDELIIKYGNKLSDRYALRHQHDYVRTQLRMLGRIKLEMMKLNSNIRDFKDIFHPQYFDACLQCLRSLAEWDGRTGTFKIPFNAQFISTLIKNCGKKLRTEYVKLQDHVQKQIVIDFLAVWEEEVPTLIHKKAHNDQMDKRRDKKVVLPSKKDIQILYEYLKKECSICLEVLDTGFNLDSYKLLTQSTLILVQIFNRRRAGEIERLTLGNYANKEDLNDNVDKELYQKLSDSTKKFAQQFTRLVIRGKLERTVPVLLNPLANKCIEQIIRYRQEAGVSDENEFIFCSLGKNRLAKPYLRACPLLRRFSNQCGAVMPSALRGTQLRKHIATYTSMLNIEEAKVDRLANFMGHHKDIHKSIYRVPVPVAEITDVSKLLLAAIGDGDEDDKDSDDNHNSDSSSDEEEGDLFQPQDRSKIQDRSRTLRELSSPKKIKRTKWTEREKQAIYKHFGDLEKLPKLPSFKECDYAIKENKILANRTPQHVFSFINNQRRRF